MNGRTLRTTAGLAGTVAAAAAGALTVGLITGVVHTSTQSQGTTTTNTGTSTTTTTSNTSDDDSTSSTTSGVGSVSQNAQSVAGSHGS
jgi:hypothetical protein